MKKRLKRVPIVFASDLPDCPDGCGEKWCKKHKKHYFECACIGPSNAEEEGYELVEVRGKLYGVKQV